MKNKIQKLAVSLSSLLFLVSCAPKKVNGTAKVDIRKSAENGPLHPQVASRIGAVTELTLDLDLEKKTYSFVKEYYTRGADESGTVITDENSPKVLDVKFTFTGTVTAGKNDTYTLEKASEVTYSSDWGSYEARLSPIGLIPFTGSGDQSSHPERLNYFYTPYLKDNGENTKSREVVIKDNALTFPGFELTETEE